MKKSIAIDGPAGAGKSTIAKLVAKELGFIYVDTGAMYRAMALYLIRKGTDREDEKAIEEACRDADISIRYADGIQHVYLMGEIVDDHLRTEEVGNMASVSSANAAVRQKLVDLQQKLAESEDVVMDGRDIGTVVLPDSPCKIFLTASREVRAKRRYDELTQKGEKCDIKKIEADINERDVRDMTRKNSPLRVADDAILIDSSDMTIDQVKDEIIRYAKERF
ncbi:MAG: (d)CMP kinase [Lachnospiraceae bacterium]|nr:(d)CMP kinase [Lachnospiraceae bacterium]